MSPVRNERETLVSAKELTKVFPARRGLFAQPAEDGELLRSVPLVKLIEGG